MTGEDTFTHPITWATPNKLAIDGGDPVRRRDWPKWPRADQKVQRNVYDVLHSTRWSQSGESHRGWSYTSRFSSAFSDYLSVNHVIPCASGSSALSTALEALGIGPGDEVVVPGLTWVACASSVLNVGAKPVLADVCPDSLCISVSAVKALITTNTKAVMAVHWHSARADMPALVALCSENNLALIEDSSQAHGAMLNDRRAGTYGTVGVFSFQQSKLLTSGEGGVCVTDEHSLATLMERLRSDGRLNRAEMGTETHTRSSLENSTDESLFEVAGDSYGVNRCMSEFQSAILFAAVARLDDENSYRRHQAKSLDKLLMSSGLGAPAQKDLFEDSGRTYYRYTLRLNHDVFGHFWPPKIARVLAAELRIAVKEMDKPLSDNPLYKPHEMHSHHVWQQVGVDFDPSSFRLPVANASWLSIVTLPHQCLLGDDTDLNDIISALEKIALEAQSNPDRFMEST